MSTTALGKIVSSIAFATLLLYVFSIPFERSIAVGAVGALGKVVGFGAVGLGFLSLFRREGLHVRRPSLFLIVMALFVTMAVCSYFWSIAPGASLTRAFTFVQQWLVVALVWQLARTRWRQRALFQAYVLGATVAVSSMIFGLVTGWGIDKGDRFSGFDSNANWAALAIALAVPMAWHLATTTQVPLLRVLNGVYPLAALFAIGLAASRGGLIDALVGLSLVPFSFKRLGWPRSTLIVLAFAGAAFLAWSYLPEANASRIADAGNEITGGDLTGRTEIWKAGLAAFPSHPVAGSGIGTYSAAVDPILGQSTASHNGYLAILVELGLIGFGLFLTLIVLAVVPAVMATSGDERAFYLFLGAVVVVALIPANFEFHKATWVILALCTTRGALVVDVPATRPAAEAPSTGRPLFERQGG